MSAKRFTPYNPEYTPLTSLERLLTVSAASITAMIQSFDPEAKIGASLEITDQCNAGCNYCYVYPTEWDQKQRLKGYGGLDETEHKKKETQIVERLIELKKEGIVHVTLVGGEPALAPTIIKRASELFPIVWLVTNGSIRIPKLPLSVTTFVSIDGLPDIHNQSRDPAGFFKNYKYKHLEGMTAKIVQNINESERGVYIHCTLIPPLIRTLPETVEWLIKDVKKLRGIVISGATALSKSDPLAFTLNDRKELKKTIENLAIIYGWDLFPFNTQKVNEYLFEEEYVIKSSSECTIAKRIKSLKFDGSSTGKCILRDEAECETCICNMTGLMRAMESFDLTTLNSNIKTLFG